MRHSGFNGVKVWIDDVISTIFAVPLEGMALFTGCSS
jgi:hypothetical protein